MNKKIIALTAITAVSLAGISSTFANENNSENQNAVATEKNFSHKMPHKGNKMMPQISSEEKAKIEAMSDAEKQEYFQKKRAEMTAKRDAQEAVIDKLLAGTALTADEEKIRQEIITERAERKKQMEEMKQKRDQIEKILEKKKAGTELTADEQKILEEMGSKGKFHGGKKSQNRGEKSSQKNSRQ